MSPITKIAVRAGLAALALAAAVPAAAQAATIERKPGSDVIHYDAAPGEPNRLAVDAVPERNVLVFRDVVRVTNAPGSLCTSLSRTAVECSGRVVLVDLGDGDDIFRTSTSVQTTVLGGPGADSYDYVDHPGASDVMFSGGEGIDTASYANAGGPVQVHVDPDGPIQQVMDGRPDDKDRVLSNTERLVGTPFADVLQGGSNDDTETRATLIGGAGNDTLSGGAGRDLFDAGAVADGADVINSRSEDLVSYAKRSRAVLVTVGVEDGDDGEALEGDSVRGGGHIQGGSSADSLIVGSAVTHGVILSGGGGIDRLNGGAGNDRLVGGPGEDNLFGNGGSDGHFARDGELDSIVCGGNVHDLAFVDSFEVRVVGCSTVERPT